MDKIEAPVNEARKIKFKFPQPQRSGLKVITLKNINHAYGNTVVYRGMNFEAERGQRIVLVGPNGAGKSTLLKLLSGVLPVQGGTRESAVLKYSNYGLNLSAVYYNGHDTNHLVQHTGARGRSRRTRPAGRRSSTRCSQR